MQSFKEAQKKITSLEDDLYSQKEKELDLLKLLEQEQKPKIDKIDVALRKYLKSKDNVKGAFIKEAVGEYLVNGTKRVRISLEDKNLVVNGKMTIDEFILKQFPPNTNVFERLSVRTTP